MEKELEKFLTDLCTTWGFCLPPEKISELSKSKKMEATEFAKLVLEAEGMNSEIELEWFRKIRNRFNEQFG